MNAQTNLIPLTLILLAAVQAPCWSDGFNERLEALFNKRMAGTFIGENEHKSLGYVKYFQDNFPNDLRGKPLEMQFDHYVIAFQMAYIDPVQYGGFIFRHLMATDIKSLEFASQMTKRSDLQDALSVVPAIANGKQALAETHFKRVEQRHPRAAYGILQALHSWQRQKTNKNVATFLASEAATTAAKQYLALFTLSGISLGMTPEQVEQRLKEKDFTVSSRSFESSFAHFTQYKTGARKELIEESLRTLYARKGNGETMSVTFLETIHDKMSDIEYLKGRGDTPVVTRIRWEKKYGNVTREERSVQQANFRETVMSRFGFPSRPGKGDNTYTLMHDGFARTQLQNYEMDIEINVDELLKKNRDRVFDNMSASLRRKAAARNKDKPIDF